MHTRRSTETSSSGAWMPLLRMPPLRMLLPRTPPWQVASLWLTLLLATLSPVAFAQDEADTEQAVDPFAAFADETLRAAVEQACTQVEAKDEPLTPQSLLKLRYLDVRDQKIESLKGLEGCTELSQLKLSGNRIADLSPLAACTRLELLEASDNRIGNLSPLKALTSLRLLNIDGNRVESLMPLQACRELRYLSARNNRIVDLAGCGTMTKLHALLLSGNRVTSPALPADMAALSTVDLTGNQVENLADIKALRLSWLLLADNQIEQLEPLVDTVRQQLNATQQREWRVTVRLEGNPLSEESRLQCRQLQQLGATVTDRVISVKSDDPEQPAESVSDETDSDE